jgi:tetratricopeptide (TPR) repeat protein
MLPEALDHCEKVVELEPQNTEARLLLAGILSALNRQDDSVAQYREVIALEPRNQEAYLYLGALYGKQGKYDQAVATLTKLIELNPRSVLGYYYLGRVHTSAGQLDRAEHYFREALARNPQSELILMDLATLYELRKDYPRAIELYQQILASEVRSCALPGVSISGRRSSTKRCCSTMRSRRSRTIPRRPGSRLRSSISRRASTIARHRYLRSPPSRTTNASATTSAPVAQTQEYAKASSIPTIELASSYVDARIQLAGYQREDKTSAAIKELQQALEVKGKNGAPGVPRLHREESSMAGAVLEQAVS